MKNMKIIYKITIDKPYINIQKGIISKLTFQPKHGEKLESIKKIKYQPSERAIFKAALIELTEEILPKVSEGRSIEVNDIPLIKITDDTFQFEVISSKESNLDDNAQEKKLLIDADCILRSVKDGLADDINKYKIISFKRVICHSDSCDENNIAPPKTTAKRITEF